MPMEPGHFDEDFMNKYDMDGTVFDIGGAHVHISTLLGDHQFKQMDDFVEGMADYHAKLSIVPTVFNSGDEEHPMHMDEVLMICFGQEQNINIVDNDGEVKKTEEHADGIAYVTPDKAREIADSLEEWADRVDNGWNKDDETNEKEE